MYASLARKVINEMQLLAVFFPLTVSKSLQNQSPVHMWLKTFKMGGISLNVHISRDFNLLMNNQT